jgi:predicted nucleotidyltransferase
MELQDILGVRVDLRIPGELSKHFLDEVLAEAAPI